ncbi:hypothetical protein J7E97_33040 [Streptomyces sp. ISL-66]|uniref:hypothetical protein n=1 Tax=Streptomyces sp. ISL-66 TaxID=2819186 RepID=UPI001BE7679D|nr:hypothetical protein [Streptomyces sp. ISL-66]MBT2472550.1 hypothetical protein [Streptomyces sp. ISL-66]
MTTTTAQAQTDELTRLRRQRLALALVLTFALAVLATVLAVGAAVFVRWAPAWADPFAVGIATFGLFIALIAVALTALQHLWRQ